MNKVKVFIRRSIYVVKKVIPAIIKEFHTKDGYTFRTNFNIEDEAFYKMMMDKLGADYRIDNNATDMYGRPIGSHYRALYVRGTYNWDKFHKAYSKYMDDKNAAKWGKKAATSHV